MNGMTNTYPQAVESAASADVPLSVVVPTHARTDLYLQTLQAIEAQTLPGFELIVTDDSRSWEDRRVIQDAAMAYAARTGRPASYLFSKPGLGQAANTNQGLRRARGRYVRILHSDDLLAPRALEAEVALLDDARLGLDLLYHQVLAFTQAPAFDKQPSLSLLQPSLLFRSVLHSGTPLPSATVFRRDLLDRVGGMREDLDFLCDWEFVARLVAEQHRRHRFVGMLSPGFVAWRVHGESTTGRLWHRHFLEHEQFMRELQRDALLCEALIGDRGTRDGFFATAVRYRYRRLHADVARMPIRQALRSLPRILRCALSPASLRERLRPAPWTARGQKQYPSLVVPCRADVVNRPATPPAPAPARPRLVEPRAGWRFALSAHLAGTIIRAGKAYALAVAPLDPGSPSVLPDQPGPELVEIGTHVEIGPSMAVAFPPVGTVAIRTEYNNSINLWAVRGLMAQATDVALAHVNSNAFVEPVLHQMLKFVPVGAEVETRLTDNQHLTGFGFKALVDKQFPGQFAWTAQGREGPVTTQLRYRRYAPAPIWHDGPHTGWTFGMLTNGTRLDNVARFIESIEQHCREPYEILIVSPVALDDLESRRHVRVIRFTEHDDLGWITKKKNLICEQALYSDVLVCHDRFWLDEDFTQQFADWGFAYGVAALRVRLPDGRRALDWGVVSSQNQVWSEGGLLDYRAYSQYVYNPGGATVIRKAFWRRFPWNENLFWNEHEDVELCRRIQRAGGIIALASAGLVTAEDRWVDKNPLIPYCDQNEVLYGQPVGEQRILFLPRRAA
jgi:glycosyltransferase involved in cell wall biosynthesis